MPVRETSWQASLAASAVVLLLQCKLAQSLDARCHMPHSTWQIALLSTFRQAGSQVMVGRQADRRAGRQNRRAGNCNSWLFCSADRMLCC